MVGFIYNGMNILYIVPYVPNRIRVRPYSLIRALAERGHRIILGTLYTDAKEYGELEELRPYCAEIYAAPMPTWHSLANALQALPTGDPLQSVYSWNGKLARNLSHRIASPDGKPPIDIVHVEHLRGARYGVYLSASPDGHGHDSKRRPPVVWDSVDSISLLFRQAAARSRRLYSRLISRFELPRTERFEGWLANQFAKVLVTSSADRAAIFELAHSKDAVPEIAVLPNGVDCDYFAPGLPELRQPSTLVISGKMSYHANVAMCLSFVSEVLPLVQAEMPEVRLLIVGKDPPAEVRALAENPAVTVTGTVEDIRPYLQKATLAVAPLAYGTGIQNKVLEAMACATPVVASSQAVAALNVINGRDVIIADAPHEMAHAMLTLLNNIHRRQAVGMAGRRYVEENHRWQNIAARLEEIYDGIIGN